MTSACDPMDVTVPAWMWCLEYIPSHSCNGTEESEGEGRE